MSKQSKKNYDCVGKVVILGDSAVGKTNILLRFTEDVYRPSHLATIGVDFRNKSLEVDGRMLRFQLWDTAGQERFKTIAQTYYKNAAGIILVLCRSDSGVLGGRPEKLQRHLQLDFPDQREQRGEHTQDSGRQQV